MRYFPVTFMLGTHQDTVVFNTKEMPSNASQTISASVEVIRQQSLLVVVYTCISHHLLEIQLARFKTKCKQGLWASLILLFLELEPARPYRNNLGLQTSKSPFPSTSNNHSSCQSSSLNWPEPSVSSLASWHKLSESLWLRCPFLYVSCHLREAHLNLKGPKGLSAWLRRALYCPDPHNMWIL